MTSLSNLNIVIVFMFFFCGCRQKEQLPQAEYIRFLNSPECELYNKKTLNKVSFISKLQPPELITLLSASGKVKTQKDFDLEKKDHKNQCNVTFLIQDESPADHVVKEVLYKEELYSQLLSYANSELQNDFSIELANGEIVPCSFVHLEAANAIQPVIRISLAFYNMEENQECTLIFDDKLFNNGRIKFHYGKDVFATLPTLKI